MTKEQIIDRLLKIKSLAEEGVAGERESAKALLASLMQKYGISPDELDSDEIGFHLTFTGNGPFDYKLFVQVIHHMYEGKKRPRLADLRKAPKANLKAWNRYGLGPANSNIGVECTKAEFMEIVSTFEIYKQDLYKQADNFYYAYLDKNGLLLAPKEGDDNPTDEEIEQALSAKLMSQGIKKKTINKLIEE